MGFGYGDESTFSLAVLRKWGASPKVLVVNADPFFSDKLSPPARDALESRPAFLWRLALKMLLQGVHRGARLLASNVWPESCASSVRSAKDVEWDWVGPYIKEKSVPIAGPAQTTITQEELALAKTLGEKILDQIGLDRQCVILTGAPNSFLDSAAIATALAAR